tara:strand:- start:3092 stop:4003 length:912 start_codon:yes stop_codon:yes gene_type:complete
MDFSSLYDCFKKISLKIRYNNLEDLNTKISVNSSNDDVIKIDKYANDTIIDFVNSNRNIIGYISEEEPNIVFKNESEIDESSKNFILTFDPIDGSKNIVSNTTSGTIYSVLEYDFKNDKILDIYECGYCIYGASTIMVIGRKYNVNMYQLGINNQFDHVKKITSLGEDNVYHCNEAYTNILDEDIKQLLHYYKNKNYSLRWVGSIVADCHQIIMNGGVFIYSNNKKNQNGKIRFFYEAIPLSFIFEQLGGIGLDINLNSVTKNIKCIKLKEVNVHKQIPIIICSIKDYVNMNSILDTNNSIFC